MPDPVAGRRLALVMGPSAGGIGRHVRSLAEGLAAAGEEVEVFGPPATLARFDMGAGAAHPRPPVAVAALRGADLVHAHGLRAGLLCAAFVARRSPLVVTWHNAALVGGPRGAAREALARLLARRADVSLCVSADLAERVRRFGGRDVRPAVVAAPPASAAEDSACRLRAGLGAAHQPLVLSVGRLHRQKAHDILIEAATRIGGEPPPVVAIAGDGPLRSQLQRQIARTGAPVRLLGWRGDVADLLAAADLVVLPSRWEGASLALQEALRAGRPMVATAVGGTPELAGGGALLVPPGDPAALAAAIRRLLADPAVAAEYAARARLAAAALPTQDDVVAQVRAVYAELLGR